MQIFINGDLADTRPLASVQRIFFNGSGDDDIMDASGVPIPVTMMGRGGDLLIAGYTAFDANPMALAAILAEWTSGRAYETRVANLRGDGNGPRLNQSYFLKASGIDATVFDDDDDDHLTGGSGRDRFFANTRHRNDKIVDLGSLESVDELG